MSTSHRQFTSGPPAPIFDYDRSLARLGGDPRLFSEIALLFLEDSPQLLERARRGLAEHDLPELERAAHSLKGLSVNFDASQLASAAYSVEQHAHQQDVARATACFGDLERELERLQRSLREFRASEHRGSEGGEARS